MFLGHILITIKGRKNCEKLWLEVKNLQYLACKIEYPFFFTFFF